jgi:hypothetical protein
MMTLIDDAKMTRTGRPYAAIADPDRFAIEHKIDGGRGLIVFRPDGVVETGNRLASPRLAAASSVRRRTGRLAERLPILWGVTVLDATLWQPVPPRESRNWLSKLRLGSR